MAEVQIAAAEQPLRDEPKASEHVVLGAHES
jgi:hypothetical protein